MKKTFAVVISLLISISFVSCGNSNANTQKSATNTQNVEKTEKEKTTIVAGKSVKDADVSQATTAKSTSDGFLYEISSNCVTITGYTGEKTNITIPEKIDNKSVTKIGENAFANSKITSVSLGNYVEEICAWSFENCKKLTKISFGKSLQKIDELAFWDCFELTSVVIPKNVEYIGQSSFFECVKLTSVTIENPTAKIEKYAFGYYNVSKASIIGGMTIFGAKNSTAKKYADSNKIAFKVK